MRCASPVTFWAYDSVSGSSRVQVDGLGLSVEGAACTGSQLVVLTQSELDAATASPFRLSRDEAAAIAGAILLVWAAAFAVRVLARLIDTSDPPESS